MLNNNYIVFFAGLLTLISCSNETNKKTLNKNISDSTKVKKTKKDTSSKDTNKAKIVIKESSPKFIKDNCKYEKGGDIRCNRVKNKSAEKLVGWEVPNTKTTEEVDLNEMVYDVAVSKLSAGRKPTGTVAIYIEIRHPDIGFFPEMKYVSLRKNVKEEGVELKSKFDTLRSQNTNIVKGIEIYAIIDDEAEFMIDEYNPKIVLADYKGIPRLSINLGIKVSNQIEYLTSNDNITEVKKFDEK
jgi:hypothetical protein